MERKVVLITGASSGIGRETARAFAKQGMSLILGARRVERLESFCGDLEAEFGVRAVAVYMDVRDYPALEKSIASLPKELQAVDILINNAGLSLGAAKAYEADLEKFDNMFDTNVKGVYNMTRLILPGMMERNRGHIINIGSIAGLAAYTTGSAYCASKAAVKTFTEATRLDVHTSDIRVTLIEPGMTSTEFMAVKFDEVKDYYGGVECLQPEDVADIILYAATCPPHVNICELVVMPTHQAAAALVHRRTPIDRHV